MVQGAGVVSDEQGQKCGGEGTIKDNGTILLLLDYIYYCKIDIIVLNCLDAYNYRNTKLLPRSIVETPSFKIWGILLFIQSLIKFTIFVYRSFSSRNQKCVVFECNNLTVDIVHCAVNYELEQSIPGE